MTTINEDILDQMLRHEVGLRRFEAGTIREIMELLQRIDVRVTAELAKRDPGSNSFTDRRLRLLLRAIRGINEEAYRAVTDKLQEQMRGLASLEGGFQDAMLRQVATTFDLDVVTPSSAQLWAAVRAKPFLGRVLRQFVEDLPKAALRVLESEITAGFVEGRTTDQIIRDVRGTAELDFEDGTLQQSRRSTAMLVRTALNHTANEARAQVYRDNKNLIKGVQWVSTLDGRTSAICRARDGMVFPVDDGPRPPAHPNCRSTTVPVLKSWKQLGIKLKEAPPSTRASLNGQVPEKQTYQQWLKKQSVGFQDDVLGVKKGQLFRKGGLDLTKFVDRKGQEFTLDELRIRERDAWKKAFGSSD